MSGIQTYVTMLKEKMQSFGVTVNTITYSKTSFALFLNRLIKCMI